MGRRYSRKLEPRLQFSKGWWGGVGNRGCKSFHNLGKILEHVIKWMTYDCLKLAAVPTGFSLMLTASQINGCTKKPSLLPTCLHYYSYRILYLWHQTHGRFLPPSSPLGYQLVVLQFNSILTQSEITSDNTGYGPVQWDWLCFRCQLQVVSHQVTPNFCSTWRFLWPHTQRIQ